MKRLKRSNVVGSIAPAKTDYTIIIPAAGMGKRMKSYGPKNLIEIREDKTILDNQIDIINKTFKNRCHIVLVTGFESQKFNIEKRNLEIIVNEDYENNNVVKSIGMGLELAKTDNVLVIYGDLVFNQEALKAPFGYYSMVLTDKSNLMAKKEVGCIVENNILQQIMYDLPNKWAQISFFTGEELEKLKEICSQDKFDKRFGFEAINMIIEDGGIFAAFSPKNMRITDIDSSKDLSKVEDII